jgi:prepilin signal peptidase PulO-like enzyme (type II secretory pathway)
LPAHPDAEREVISSLLAAPGLYVYIHQLRGAHFTDEGLGELWATITERNAAVSVPDVERNKQAMRVLEGLEELVPADLDTHLRESDLSIAALASLASVQSATKHTDREKLIDQASLVYNAGEDRLEYAGNSRVELTGDLKKPLRRVLGATTIGRKLIVAVMLAVGGAVSLAVGAGRSTDSSGWLITAALLVLTIGSVIWALVDQDTMYIDLPTFYILTAGAWLLAILAGLLGEGLSVPLRGLVVSVVVVLFIEVINQIFRRVRGQHGMGGGDYLLIVATIGVPVAVTGDWLLGQWVLILSLLAGIVGWVTARLTKPGFSKASPYAFGPYLASGWLIALALWAVS